jgi:hypothetical protein
MFGLGINKLGTPRDQALPEPETLLFANDEEGTFLDFTTTQVYADTAGTDPAEVGEGIALTLDKSQGANILRRNLLAYTEEFDNAFWEKSATATVTANQIAAPDNTTTADLFRCGTTSASEVRRNNITLAAGNHTFSVFARKEVSDFLVIQVFDVATTSFRRVWFNINLGSTGSATSGGTNITPLGSSIEPYENGFYRVSITVSLTAGTVSGRTNIFLSEGDGVFSGNALSGIYIWGAQLETGSTLTPYQEITTGINGEWTPGTHSTQATSAARPIFGRVPVGGRRNLLLRTEEFDNAVWLKFKSSITPNATIAPDGTSTADKLIEDTTANDTHAVANYGSQTVTLGVTYTYSAFVKAAERGFVTLTGDVSTGKFGGSAGVQFALTDGSVTKNLLSLATTATNVGNGWWHFSITATALASGTAYPYLAIGSKIATSFSGRDSYTGDGTSGIYVWGAQLEQAASPSAYQKVVTQHDITEAGIPSIYKAFFDKADDILPVTLPTITGGTVALVGTSGIWIEEDWGFTAGTLSIGPTTIAGLPAGILSVVGDLCAVIINDRAWTAAEYAEVVSWGKARGAPGVFSLGEELVTNGDLSSATGWTVVGTQVSISGGVAPFTGSAAYNVDYIEQAISVSASDLYLVSLEVKNYVSGGPRLDRVGAQTVASNFGAGNGVKDVVFAASNTSSSYFRFTTSGGGFEGEIDNISVRKLELIP